MNSQRGKASSNASRQQQSKNAGPNAQAKVQREKPTITHPKRKRRNRGGGAGKGDLSNVRSSTGRLGLTSGNRSGTNRRAQVIEEDEYIAEVNGSVLFATTAYNINPGQASTFPWAAKIAGLYEKYRFSQLEFYYRREVSEFSTNGAAGKVMLSCDYDASDSPPTTKQQVEDTVPHADGMPCTERITLRLDCRAMSRQDSMYVRPGVQPVNTDIKTYDAGIFYVSTYGCANTSVVGELRVRYRCELMVPVLENVSNGATGTVSYFSQQALAAGATTVGKQLFAGVVASTNNNSGITISNVGGGYPNGTFTFPAGRYLVELSTLSVCSAADFSSNSQAIISNGTQSENSSYLTSFTATRGNGTLQNIIANTTSTILWDTATFGVYMGLWLIDTYSAGTVTDEAILRITTL